MGWNSDGFRWHSASGFDIAHVFHLPFTDTRRATLDVFVDHFIVVMVVTVMPTAKRVNETIGGSLDAAAERMIVAFVVVVAHVASVSGKVFTDLFFLYDDFFPRTGFAALVFDVVSWVGATAIFALGDVKLSVVASVVCTVVRTVVCSLTIFVSVDFDVNFGVPVSRPFPVAKTC